MLRLKSYYIPLQMHSLPICCPDACVLEAFYILREFGCGEAMKKLFFEGVYLIKNDYEKYISNKIRYF